jgi:polysaccharide biosynthesis protein PslF
VTLSIGFLSTYPPTPCGLATFTSSLRSQLLAGGSQSAVVRVVDQPDRTVGLGVVGHLVRGSVTAQVKAAKVLDRFDVAVVQHEFGIYGGMDGDEVLGVLDRLTVPAIVVAHTVLKRPARHQREVFHRVASRATAIVAMTISAHRRLIDTYHIDPGKVEVIPHGAVTAGRTGRSRVRFGPATILTWGLLGPSKGIEAVIDVLPMLRGLDRQPLYRVVGRTHPEVLRRDGEAYRRRLVARAAARGVADLVVFEGGYLDAAALHEVVAQADVVVLPYKSREQVTSGVLVEAMAAGKPVVATAFPHAVELLGMGGGLVVPHGDPEALTRALRRVLVEPGLTATMAERSSRIAAEVQWSEVAARYRHLADSIIGANAVQVTR